MSRKPCMKNGALRRLSEIVANRFREEGVKASIQAYSVQTHGGPLAIVYELTFPNDSAAQQTHVAQDIANKEVLRVLLSREKST